MLIAIIQNTCESLLVEVFTIELEHVFPCCDVLPRMSHIGMFLKTA